MRFLNLTGFGNLATPRLACVTRGLQFLVSDERKNQRKSAFEYPLYPRAIKHGNADDADAGIAERHG